MQRTHPRNGAIFDAWSLVHLATGVMFGLLLNPFAAWAIMIAWEPLEIFVLSPLLYKVGIEFGYETWQNSVSDIVFDALGIAIGYGLLQLL